MTPRVMTVAALVAIASVSPAVAKQPARKPAPTPVCHLLDDPLDDMYYAGTTDNPNPNGEFDAFDLTGGDFATTPKEVIGVVRLKTARLDTTHAPMLGGSWWVQFVAGGISYTFKRNVGYGLTSTTYQFVVGNDVTKTVPKVEVTDHDIVFSVPRSAVPTLDRRHPVVTVTNAQTKGVNQLVYDVANPGVGKKVLYTDLTPSCVRPPK